MFAAGFFRTHHTQLRSTNFLPDSIPLRGRVGMI
jgi:hypothetical protein